MLFVLIMDYLSRLLKNMSYLPYFHFHPMCQRLRLTHLIFADNLMIFSKGEVSLVIRIIEALAHFSASSGLVANMEKYSVFLICTTDHVKQQILTRTSYALGSFPIRYLGLPLSFKRWCKIECYQLGEKITTRIKNVYARQLSYAVRLQVVVAIFFFIYNLLGSVFILKVY